MRANVSNPSLDRRLGNGHQEQRGQEQRNVPETDSAHHREVAGQPDHAVAQMLRWRDTLHVRCAGQPPVLIVEVIPLRDDKPILYRIVECRQCMHSDMVEVLAPTALGLRPQLSLKVMLAEIKQDNRRAICNRRAHKGVLGYLRDSRRKLHLHGHCHPTPFATTDVPLDTLRRG